MRRDDLWMIRNGAIVPVIDKPVLLPANEYINFGSVAGVNGYGFRDNSGVLEFKNSAGTWVPFGTGSGGSLVVDNVTGTVNGTNTAFTIPTTFTGESMIVLNLQTYVEGVDYTHSGTNITFVVAPPDMTGFGPFTFAIVHT